MMSRQVNTRKVAYFSMGIEDVDYEPHDLELVLFD